MPRFSFRHDLSDDLYWGVLRVFGFAPNDMSREFIDLAMPEVQAGLDALRAELLALHHPSDHGRCLPGTWTRRKALLLLRHVLRTRGRALVSRVVRRPGTGKCTRAYSVHDATMLREAGGVNRPLVRIVPVPKDDTPVSL